MQTFKKMILIVICLVVLLTSFIQPAAAVELPDIELPDTPYEDMVDAMDPYAMMPLIEPQYDYYPDNEFRFNSYVYDDIEFLYREYLPYGDDTVVLGFRNDENVIYLLFFDGNSVSLFNFLWNSNNGRCAYEFLSAAPVYRIAYSLKYGYPVSFASYTGLTDQGVTSSTNSLGVTSYYMNYTFIAGDFYVTVTPNYLKAVGLAIDVDGTGYEAQFGGTFGIGVYPGVDSKNNLIQQEQNELLEEQNETSKGMWESIKELPTKIANSIKGFFTSLGDRISDFFSNLGDRISGFFSNLGDRISGFFSNLGDRISGFFESLKNYLLYFQDTEPEHVNPFNNLLADVKTFFEQQMSDVDDFKRSLNNALDNVVSYIQTGSGVVNTFLTAVPILSAFITFFVVFYVVRKVVGR